MHESNPFQREINDGKPVESAEVSRQSIRGHLYFSNIYVLLVTLLIHSQECWTPYRYMIINHQKINREKHIM